MVSVCPIIRSKTTTLISSCLDVFLDAFCCSDGLKLFSLATRNILVIVRPLIRSKTTTRDPSRRMDSLNAFCCSDGSKLYNQLQETRNLELHLTILVIARPLIRSKTTTRAPSALYCSDGSKLSNQLHETKLLELNFDILVFVRPIIGSKTTTRTLSRRMDSPTLFAVQIT